ncbi:MAG: hypothetical protein LBL90_03720 [Prevotellaceae bacterium]|jgi:hypothetical protein|nr:hypothetical protein [Prevotellaceae bacterium]
MKNLFLYLCSIALVFVSSCNSKTEVNDLTPYHGIWANIDCELVQTDKYTLFFNRNGNTISVILRQNERVGDTVFSNFIAGYVFDKETKKYESLVYKDDEKRITITEYFRLKDGKLEFTNNKQAITLQLIEKIDICSAYEMPLASADNIGECLQTWQLGSWGFNPDPNNTCVEIRANRHVYVFLGNQYTVYCRAARQRNNNNGTVFDQNIRLMANPNEFTVYMAKDNFKTLSEEVIINDSLFKPDECHFIDDGSIYWSLIAFSADTININGCGETYTYTRPAIDSKSITEWFKYHAY